jgi:hypothetical protein
VKYVVVFVALFLQYSILLGHGFGADTLVLLADGGWQQINTICHRVQKKKVAIASYDIISSFQTNARVIRGGCSQANCYIRLGFKERAQKSKHHDEIACTPTQEFYVASTRQWMPPICLRWVMSSSVQTTVQR